MKNKVATLSTTGWEEEPYGKADRLIAYFFLSDASQSNLYDVNSIQNLIKEKSDNYRELELAINDSLSAILLAYFDSVELNIAITAGSEEDKGTFNITVSATVIEDDKRYNLGKLASVVDSKIMRIAELDAAL